MPHFVTVTTTAVINVGIIIRLYSLSQIYGFIIGTVVLDFRIPHL